MDFYKLRKPLIIISALLTIVSIFFCFRLKPYFDFEQFFPDSDPELDFYFEYKAQFEADDNFLLIALKRNPSIYNKEFLTKAKAYTEALRKLPHVVGAESVATAQYPIISPLGFTIFKPVINIKNDSTYAKDSLRITKDVRIHNTLVNDKATALVVAVKNVNDISIAASNELMKSVDSLNVAYGFKDIHMLGRPYFTVELATQNIQEFILLTIAAGCCVVLVLWLIYRRFWGIFIALSSVTISLIVFLGILGILGKKIDTLAMLYPILMVIVGTSDVIHVLTKYTVLLQKGFSQRDALSTTFKEIGVAIFLTSTTTAIGFASLATSKLQPVRDFGINSAIGVVVAYVMVLIYTLPLISYFNADKISKKSNENETNFWDKWLLKFYSYTVVNRKMITGITISVLILSGIGISMVTTNYKISAILPKNTKVSKDFFFFEKYFNGFRPFEMALKSTDGSSVDEYENLKKLNELEAFIGKNYPEIGSLVSLNTFYKSIHQAINGNAVSAYIFPTSNASFQRIKNNMKVLPEDQVGLFISNNKDMVRVSGRIQDIGADRIREIEAGINQWVSKNMDTSKVKIIHTGTGLIIDRNSAYVRDGLLYGLGLAVILVAILMSILFKNIKLVVVSLLPNILPLLVCGGIMGFFGIELDAGIAIIFAIIFGIAVDDTIHFLSNYRLFSMQGIPREQAIKKTILETGKAITLTSIILFFGFIVLLMSRNYAIVVTGILIATTLIVALLCDIFFLPLLIRWILPKDKVKTLLSN